MKKMILAAVAALLTVGTAQANESAFVGISVIARTVIEKKLVDKEAREVLALGLETGSVGFGEMECDRAAGKDLCSFDVFVKDDESTEEAEETLYRLDVIIREGKISSATFSLLAG